MFAQEFRNVFELAIKRSIYLVSGIVGLQNNLIYISIEEEHTAPPKRLWKRYILFIIETDVQSWSLKEGQWRLLGYRIDRNMAVAPSELNGFWTTSNY